MANLKHNVVLRTTTEPRRCAGCGGQAAIGAGVARPTWWCLRCLPPEPLPALDILQVAASAELAGL